MGFCKPLFAVGVGMLLMIVVSACASMEPFEYRSDNEVKEGPGLFTGKKGALVIFDNTGSETEENISAHFSQIPSMQISGSHDRKQDTNHVT